MDIRPILTTLRRHKTAAALIVFEIALSCAIICNAVFLISNRLELMNRTSGLAENEIVRVQLTGINNNEDARSVTQADLAALRALPGVKAATVSNQVTFGNSSWNSGVSVKQDQPFPNLSATTYFGDEQLLDTLGLNLIAGRRFTNDEYINYEDFDKLPADAGVPAAIVTKVVAEKLFPGENAVGKVFYSWGPKPIRIVGVVDHLARPNNRGGAGEYEYSMIFPIRVTYEVGGNYLLRVDPSRRDETMKAAMAALEKSGPTRIILEDQSKTLETMRREFYQQDRSMAWLLVAVCIALLVVTALGIVGLASFWVQQRTKQIGVRRALGATRGQVLRYFQTENFLLATLGIMIGMALAYGINMVLMSAYELPRLPAIYLPLGAVALWALGQIAVFGPARRAAAVPPAVATRSI
ncbi:MULTISPECIES: FtsX-like permease family protein [unclassified Lysobacter]|uniref:ABC transporter permease n=1 Tax=unclassified Lysobacter TaxID=2635362 RepID=UPI0006F7288F|nr:MULTISPECIES: FtsX-like permease family protein [unclassified Lysobacter]KRA16222.1 ABC transporter permease [Lysobacter sp. Root604]KRD31923.1 ABC transporter permease [Lysobacter sp. Root916]KRD75791.1 ABC transporter permease [Lysobacter sp. Root983]